MKQVINQFFVPHNILEEEKFISMKLSSQMLYMHLCRLKNRLKNKEFYRDLKTLSRETGMHINTLKKAKKELKKNQYINIKRDYFLHSGHRSADVFSLNGYRYRNPTV